jgi:hypothetical protein
LDLSFVDTENAVDPALGARCYYLVYGRARDLDRRSPQSFPHHVEPTELRGLVPPSATRIHRDERFRKDGKLYSVISRLMQETKRLLDGCFRIEDDWGGLDSGDLDGLEARHPFTLAVFLRCNHLSLSRRVPK